MHTTGSRHQCQKIVRRCEGSDGQLPILLGRQREHAVCNASAARRVTMRLVAGTLLLPMFAAGCLGPQGATECNGPNCGPCIDGQCGPNFDLGFPIPSGPQPVFGTTVSAATPPKPLSGGTLLMLPNL